jgi:Lrp/AsnC family leucine-responsive transcriptional regulator
MNDQLDATDKKIIQLLQQDGKMKIKEIAAVLKMTNTPVFDRIKKLEREGYIKSYTAKVDLQKLGYSLVAYCSVTLEKHHKDFLLQFEKDIKEIPEIIECYHIAGLFDYLLKIVTRDMVDYQYFITHKLADLKNIGKVQSSFVMTELKHEMILPI